jgi:hypothetical protein
LARALVAFKGDIDTDTPDDDESDQSGDESVVDVVEQPQGDLNVQDEDHEILGDP